jgi:hypothetical protein
VNALKSNKNNAYTDYVNSNHKDLRVGTFSSKRYSAGSKDNIHYQSTVYDFNKQKVIHQANQSGGSLTTLKKRPQTVLSTLQDQSDSNICPIESRKISGAHE